MNTIWTLTVRTSLPETCDTGDTLKVTNEAFTTFKDARDRLREILKGWAFTDNAMFDGNGYLKYFTLYIDEIRGTEREDDPEPAEDWLSSSVMERLHDSLRDAFSGNDTKLTVPDGLYSDAFISVNIAKGSVHMKGYDEGPSNGINPRVKTNIFDMTKEKDYRLYIDDLFGGMGDQECSAELYIDLKKTALSD